MVSLFVTGDTAVVSKPACVTVWVTGGTVLLPVTNKYVWYKFNNNVQCSHLS